MVATLREMTGGRGADVYVDAAGFKAERSFLDHLIELVTIKKVVLDDSIPHRLPLSEVAHGYDIFKIKKMIV